MSLARTVPSRAARARGLSGAVAGLLSVSLLAACSETSGVGGDPEPTSDGSAAASGPQAPPVRVQANVSRNASSVPVSKMVRLSAKNGTFKSVQVRSGKQVVRGGTAKGGKVWRASSRLEPGKEYVVSATTLDETGQKSPFRTRFRTADLSLDDQTYASIAPLDGETVGVGMPVIVNFDVAVALDPPGGGIRGLGRLRRLGVRNLAGEPGGEAGGRRPGRRLPDPARRGHLRAARRVEGRPLPGCGTMIVVTTPDVAGREITEVLGMVRGNTIRARHVGRDIQAKIRNITGGEVHEYTKMMAEAREQAVDRMVEDAEGLGADAIVAVRFQTCEVMNGAAEMMCYGTAVRLSTR